MANYKTATMFFSYHTARLSITSPRRAVSITTNQLEKNVKFLFGRFIILLHAVTAMTITNEQANIALAVSI